MKVSLKCAEVKEEERKARFSVKETVFFILLLISIIIYCISFYAFLKHVGYKSLMVYMCSAFFTLLLVLINFGLLWNDDK